MKMTPRFERTKALLIDCHKAGYHKITIGKPDPENNPACASWRTGPDSLWGWHPTFEGYHNGKETPKECCREGGWPAIWRISERHKVNRGCGNSHQSQISYKAVNEIVMAGTFDTTSVRKINKQLRDRFTDQFANSL